MSRKQTATFAAVLVSVVALAVAPVAAAAPAGPAVTFDAQETDAPSPDANATVAPGERLSGVVGVQQAEIQADVDERTVAVQLAQEKTDAAKAEIVAEVLADVEQRLEELDQEKQDLQQAREDGSISEGEFRAEMSEVAAETAAAERMTDAAERAADGLPTETLEEQGINYEAIQKLKNQASDVSSDQVREWAQSIAGPDVGTSVSGPQGPVDVADQIPDSAQDAGSTPSEAGDDRA